MEIYFQNKRLQKLASDIQKCKKEFGVLRTKLFYRRLNDLYMAETLENVRNLPGHFHELTGNRKGYWACDLDQPYRLIFEPHEKPIKTDDNGRYQWIEITSIDIDEITNYHEK